MFSYFTAISQVTSLCYCKTYIRKAYVVALQLISFLQGISCACALWSLLFWITFCPLPLNSFSISWCIIDLWVFQLFSLQLLSVSGSFLARSRSLQTSSFRCLSNITPCEPQALAGRTFLFMPSSCPFQADWRARSLLDRLQSVLSELFLPQGNQKEYASDDRIQANITRAFRFCQFKSHTLCCSQNL